MEITTFTTVGSGAAIHHVLRIKAPAAGVAIARAPVHFILLIDTSGSMETGSKLHNVVRSAHFMLEHLQATDHLTLIDFNTKATLLVDHLPMTAEAKIHVSQRLAAVTAEGSTNLSAALLLAKTAAQSTPAAMKTGILILTDGHANIGVTDQATLLTILQGTNASISTVGYGTDHNTDILTAMAAGSGGSYNVVSNLEDTATVFGDILGGLLSCAAQNVVVEYPVGTTVFSVLPYQADRLTIGDIQADTEMFIVSTAAATRVTGYEMPAATAFATVPSPVQPSAEQLIEATVSIARFKVSRLLTDVGHGRITAFDVPPAIAALRALVAEIPDAHPMRHILREQLTLAEGSVTLPGMSTILSQRGASIGIGRGVLTGESDPGVASPFANRVQRNISSGLRHSTQEPVSLNQLSPILGPIRHHTNLLEGISTLGELTGLEEEEVPSGPPSSLERQTASGYTIMLSGETFNMGGATGGAGKA